MKTFAFRIALDYETLRKMMDTFLAEDLFNAFAGADEVLVFVSSKAITYGKGGVECS